MFDGFIRDWAHWTPRAPAVVTPAGAVAYGRLDADIDRIGRRLLDLGVAPQSGAVAAVEMESAYLELATLCALARLGLASAPAADGAADLALADHDALGALVIGRDVLAADSRPLPALELDVDAVGRVSLTVSGHRVGASWRALEVANFANLRTWAAGRTGTLIPLGGVDGPFGFAQAVCAWSCGAAVAAGFRPTDLPAALETLAPGVVGLTPGQLGEVLEALPPGFRPQPAWRLVVDGLLPPPLAREALGRLTSDTRVLYATAEHGLIALAHAADDGLVPLTGVSVEVADTGEIHVAGVSTGDYGRRTPNGRLILERARARHAPSGA